MDDEADSRGPAPPSWPEGIDPEELERQRFQLRKFERVHKQLHTHSNGGTKRKIQGKGTDTGVTRLLRNRSLVASHCPFCTQLRIANTTGQNNAAAKACACSGAEARGSTTFHFTLDRPVNNEPLKSCPRQRRHSPPHQPRRRVRQHSAMLLAYLTKLRHG